MNILVIGGGPAGMMAAITAAKNGARVTLLEKNSRCGEKLRISGGGRCNVTNNTQDNRKLLPRYGKGEPFLHAPFSQFAVADTVEFFKELGVDFKEENEGRMFPKTEKAETIAAALEKKMDELGVDVYAKSPVASLLIKEGAISGARLGSGEEIHADRIIITTGGNSRPETGSTGDAFAWLKPHHRIEHPEPVLVPITTLERWTHSMSGLAFADAKISLEQGGAILEKKKGKLLFTHFGLSGPLVLNMSRAITSALADDPVKLHIDLFPSMDAGALDRDILAKLAPHQNKNLENALGSILPPLLVTGIGNKLNLDPEMKVHQFGRDMRKALVTLLKDIVLTPTGSLGAEKAVVTSGGVPLAEVDTKTMSSMKIKNLFLAGDVLDIDRPSGGYSLQLCWTTGYVAGKNAAQ
jgi:predicted Rossmann fold flavoprotein